MSIIAHSHCILQLSYHSLFDANVYNDEIKIFTTDEIVHLINFIHYHRQKSTFAVC